MPLSVLCITHLHYFCYFNLLSITYAALIFSFEGWKCQEVVPGTRSSKTKKRWEIGKWKEVELNEAVRASRYDQISIVKHQMSNVKYCIF